MNHLSSSSPLAKDLMNSDAVPLRPGVFRKDLILQFLSGQYSGWPVVDSTGKILGVVAELRLLQACSRLNSLDELRVEDTMTTPVYLYEDDPLDVVLKVMIHRQLLRMPVVCDRNLVGVISRGDVLRHCLPLSSSSSRFVFSCPWCERVHDPSDGLTGTEGWRDLPSYLSMHHRTFSEVDLSQTYCSSCLQFLQALKTTSPGVSRDETEAQAQEVRPCMLVVDDDPSVARLLDRALQEWGYEVVIARNGREGLDVVGCRSVDGILLDTHMPIMDGRTMLDELRWLGHQMPVLMMSGASEEQSLRRLLQEGAQGFFLKPFHLASLQQACRKIFQNDDAKAQAFSRFDVA
ncbi:response regulator [uncultured Nitrospira sp.]|uniref:response regulator n=1 Tax=uncultured Nitrospira sp. TaxID=157176 RepID=UPI00314062CA